jgi:hypothetical protein
MKAHQVLLEALSTSRFVMSSYLGDLTDDDLLVRPVDGAHNAAWQLGHLICSEAHMIEGIRPQAQKLVSADFARRHDKSRAFEPAELWAVSKSEYLSLMELVRSATLNLLEELSEEELSAAGPEFTRKYALTVGSVFTSISGHELMHAGQIAVIRRKLGKPVVI